MAPVSASTAVTQPAFRESCTPKPLAEPRKDFPSSNSGTAGSSLSVEHQSMLFTYTRFVAAEKAGPFHDTPPATPGQKCVPSTVTGTSLLVIVVTAVFHATLPDPMSIACRVPS